MAKEQCVFCGKDLGVFNAAQMIFASTIQKCCKSCAKEMEGAEEEELCRAALRMGLAESAHVLEQRLQIMAEAEENRPTCLRCGTKLKFKRVLQPEITRAGLCAGIEYANIYGAAPAVCPNCGKMEFYDINHTNEDPKLAYLIKKDTEQ